MYLSTRLANETLTSINRMWSMYCELQSVIDGLHLYLISGGDESNQDYAQCYGEKERQKHIEYCTDSIEREVTKLSQLYPNKELQKEFAQVLDKIKEIYYLISQFDLRHIIIHKGSLQARVAELNLFALVMAISDHIQNTTPLSGKQAELVTMALVEQNPQAAIQQMFVLFEDTLRKRIGVGSDVYGTELINKAFADKGALTWGETPAERIGVRNLLSGTYATFRNPYMHRLIEDDPQTVLSIIVLIDLLIKIVNKAQYQGG